MIIASASSGIGEAATRRLAADGAKLVIGARRKEKLKELAASLPDADITYQVADVARPEDMENLAQRALEKHGRIIATDTVAGHGRDKRDLDAPDQPGRLAMKTFLPAIVLAAVVANFANRNESGHLPSPEFLPDFGTQEAFVHARLHL